MIKLIVDDYEQVTILEEMLMDFNVSYNIELNDKRYGLKSPFLIVGGVPLDFGRSVKWIEEYRK